MDLAIDPLNMVLALALGMARLAACLALIPVFTPKHVPRLARNAVAMSIGCLFAVAIYPELRAGTVIVPVFVLMVKEALIGAMLGVLMAMPFWAITGAGVLIDNQRGANAAQQTNPSLQADASVLGEILSRALVIVLIQAGTFHLLFNVVSDSLLLWPATSLLPPVGELKLAMVLDGFRDMLGNAIVYAAPALIVLMLVELSFATASVAVQGMPVHEMAMPIKSLLALFVLAIYSANLLDKAGGDVAKSFIGLGKRFLGT